MNHYHETKSNNNNDKICLDSFPKAFPCQDTSDSSLPKKQIILRKHVDSPFNETTLNKLLLFRNQTGDKIDMYVRLKF